MIHAIKQLVTVQAGGRIELDAPGLKPGSRAEVIILEIEELPQKRTLSSLIGTAKGSFSTPEEADAFLRKERDTWE